MTIVPRGQLAPVAELGDPEPAAKRRQRIGRLALVALAVLAGLLAWRSLARWERFQDDLDSRARHLLVSGIDSTALASAGRAARRELDPANARIEMARALLDRELLAVEPEGAVSLERLAVARALAREALARQPANHEAAMILGATLALERSRTRDTRLFSLAADWEQPLNAAIELAPGAAEPRRLLAAAYLEVWPALSPAKRRIAVDLLRDAFSDRATFERLFEAWVSVAGSLDKASELLPDKPWSWKRLADTARERESWSDFRALDDRFRSSLLAGFTADLDSAAETAQRGGVLPASILGDLLAAAPIDSEFAPIVERALSLRPAGPAADNEARAAKSWFQWAAPLCLVRDCPLSGAAFQRLASLAGSLLAPEQGAFAALAGGDSVQANLFERRSETVWSEPWAPYLTLKALLLERDGDAAGARQALSSVHRAFRVRVPWRRIAEAVALEGASPMGGPPLARSVWEASDWWFERGASRLDLVPERAASALLLEPEKSPLRTALLEVLWDGRRLPPVEIPVGAAGAVQAATRLSISSPGVTPEPHLLEIRALAGELRPAMRVRLD